jgi:disulfide bond formation protein DsbB
MKRMAEYIAEPRHLAAGIAAASALALSFAYASQYGFNLQPCALCIYQRVPYSLNFVFGLLALLATLRYPRLALLLLFAAGITFLAGAGIAAFHVGVEQGWWKGTAACGGTLPAHATVEELRKAILGRPVVRCDVPAWSFLGISMAGYNMLLSLFLGLGTIFLLGRMKRGPQRA